MTCDRIFAASCLGLIACLIDSSLMNANDVQSVDLCEFRNVINILLKHENDEAINLKIDTKLHI